MEFWSQEAGIFEVIFDISFYYTNGVPEARLSHDEVAIYVGQKFQRALRQAEKHYALTLVGLSSGARERLPQELLDSIDGTVLRLIDCEKGTPDLYYGDDRHPMPFSPLGMPVNAAIAACNGALSPEGAAAELVGANLPPQLARQLIETLFSLRAACAAVDIKMTSVVATSRRMNGSRAGVFRRELDSAINQMASGEPDKISGTLSALIADWIDRIRDPDPLEGLEAGTTPNTVAQ